jgi:hypothetical protein
MESNIVKITTESFVKLFSPEGIAMNFNCNTIEKVLESDSNSIAYYRKVLNPDQVQAIIELHVLNLNASINVHTKLSPNQIKEIAREIMVCYYFMSIIEVSHVFRMARRGEFGAIDYALNMPDIMIWFQKYGEIRTAHFQKKSTNEAHQRKVEIDKIPLTEDAKNLFKKIKDELPDNNEKERKFQEWRKENGF